MLLAHSNFLKHQKKCKLLLTIIPNSFGLQLDLLKFLQAQLPFNPHLLDLFIYWIMSGKLNETQIWLIYLPSSAIW